MRAARRACCRSSSASSPRPSASSGIRWSSSRAQADRLVAELGAEQLALGRRVALVEHEVDHRAHARRAAPGSDLAGRHAVRDRRRRGSCASPGSAAGRASAPARGTPARSPAWSSPATVRSVSATRASRASAGWQQVKSSRSRSSGISCMSSPIASSSAICAAAAVFSRPTRSRRSRSIARLRAVGEQPRGGVVAARRAAATCGAPARRPPARPPPPGRSRGSP